MSDNQKSPFPERDNSGSLVDDSTILEIAECMAELETRSKEQTGQIKDLGARLRHVENHLAQIGAILRGSDNRDSE